MWVCLRNNFQVSGIILANFRLGKVGIITRPSHTNTHARTRTHTHTHTHTHRITPQNEPLGGGIKECQTVFSLTKLKTDCRFFSVCKQ